MTDPVRTLYTSCHTHVIHSCIHSYVPIALFRNSNSSPSAANFTVFYSPMSQYLLFFVHRKLLHLLVPLLGTLFPSSSNRDSFFSLFKSLLTSHLLLEDFLDHIKEDPPPIAVTLSLLFYVVYFCACFTHSTYLSMPDFISHPLLVLLSSVPTLPNFSSKSTDVLSPLCTFASITLR